MYTTLEIIHIPSTIILTTNVHSYNTICTHNLSAVTLALRKKATMYQVTTMLATSKYVLFPGPNHLLMTLHSLVLGR